MCIRICIGSWKDSSCRVKFVRIIFAFDVSFQTGLNKAFLGMAFRHNKEDSYPGECSEENEKLDSNHIGLWGKRVTNATHEARECERDPIDVGQPQKPSFSKGSCIISYQKEELNDLEKKTGGEVEPSEMTIIHHRARFLDVYLSFSQLREPDHVEPHDLLHSIREDQKLPEPQ